MMHSRKRSIFVVLIVMTCIIAAFLPVLFAYKSYSNCYFTDNKLVRSYTLYVFPTLTVIILSAVPDVILFVGNIAIMIQVRRHRREVTSIGSQTSDNTSQSRVTRTAVTLALMHLILTLPSTLSAIITQRQKAGNFKSTMETVFTCLFFLNNAANIFIYLMTSEVFRQEMLKAFHILIPKKPSQDDQSSSIMTANTVTGV